jgi:hypothetical protein
MKLPAARVLAAPFLAPLAPDRFERAESDGQQALGWRRKRAR